MICKLVCFVMCIFLFACEDPSGGSHYSEEAFTVLFTGATSANKKSFNKNDIEEIIIFRSSKNNYFSYDYVRNKTNYILINNIKDIKIVVNELQIQNTDLIRGFDTQFHIVVKNINKIKTYLKIGPSREDPTKWVVIGCYQQIGTIRKPEEFLKIWESANNADSEIQK